MTAPFDQPFYDRLMDEPDVRDHATHTDGWMRGYAYCAIVAARIAAERQAVAVSDEELLLTVAVAMVNATPGKEWDDYTVDEGWQPRIRSEKPFAEAAIRAVRAALAPTVPQVPERLDHIEIEKMDNGGWRCTTHWAGSLYRHDFFGPTPFSALTAAIAAAQQE